ncbi:MAG: helix-turn-helix domain-containing protein [Saprospiraceae bacterium]|nr:helix-turn-helix domain-containing protein [Saprospiraceae bacterium]
MENLHPINVQVLTFFLGAACLHGFWLSCMICLRKESLRSKALLLSVIVASSLFLLNLLLFLTNYILIQPHLLGLFYPSLLLIGPGLYFLIKEKLNPGFRWKPIHLAHLIPVLWASFQAWKTAQKPVAEKIVIIQWLMNPEEGVNWSILLWSNYPMYLLLGYLGLSFYLFSRAHDFPAKKSSFPKVFLWVGLAVIIQLLIQFGGFALDWSTYTLEFAMAAVLVASIHSAGYFILKPSFAVERPAMKTQEKYRTSALKNDVRKKYAKILQQLLEQEKPFLNSDFRLADLAALSGIPSHQLSEVINLEMQSNFNELTNYYRIQEAKARLTDANYQHYSILAIAIDCGFQHKSTFNRVFKKQTGKTPSAYRKTVL